MDEPKNPDEFRKGAEPPLRAVQPPAEPKPEPAPQNEPPAKEGE